MLIPNLKRELKEVTQKISKHKEELATLYQRENTLINDIRNACSHPKEYQEEIWVNTDKDPLESKFYHLVCTACGKTLEKYSMVNGHKQIYKDKHKSEYF